MNQNFCPYCMNPVTPGRPCGACGLTAGSYTPLPHHLPPGTILKDRYLIGRVLGEGGFGITYIGCDLQLEVKLAIKEYFPVDKVSRNASADLTVSRYARTSKEEFERDLERFLREARTMGKLSKQKTIVTIHDFFRDNQTAYIAMEYIDGTTFKDLAAQRGGRIPAWELLHLIEPLFSALQAMHDAGLIHRDISPENLMLEDGDVRLLDFGCARDVDSDRTMTISLKHSYAPVEQYQGKGQGPWTDVYALGATMYYCLTGQKPQQAMDRLLEDELVPPRSLGVDLTKSQEQALLTAMRVRPRQRYQSMTEFHTALYEGIEVMPKSPVLMTALGEFAAGAAAAAHEEGSAQTESTIAQNRGTLDQSGSTFDRTGNIPEQTERTSEQKTGDSTSENENASVQDEHTSARSEGIIEQDESESASAGDGGPGNAILAWLKKNPLVTGICAAVIALVLIVGIVFGIGSGSGSGGNTADTVTAGSEEGSEETTGTDKPYTIEDGVAYVTDCEEDTLLEALADDDVESVVVSGNGWIYTTETLEIHKPLTLESGIYASSPVIVGEGVITEGNSTWYYNVIDEDALFADAVSVTNEEELREAAEDESVTAIIITGDITLTENFTQTVPVLIEEGVTVIALGADQDLDEDGNIVSIDGDIREEGFEWWVDAQTVLINHGTIKGDFFSGGEENDESAAWVINDGTIDVSGIISGMLINLEDGICNLMHGALSLGGVVNLGTFTHTPRIGMTEMKMESYFFNSGTLLIEGPEDNAPYACLASGELRNSASGIIEIGEHACMANLTGIENQGQIILTSVTSSFLNQGTLDMANQYVGTLEVSYGSFENTGLVRYKEDGYPYASEDANALCADAEVWVYSASELQEALQDESISRIRIEGDITWEDGDLLISEKEVMQDGSLTVTGGNLTVEDGAFWCSGEISLDGGTFTAQGLGVVYAGGGISGCSVLNIQASSTVILGDGELHDMEINLNVEDGENGDATLTTKYGLSLYNCQMTLATENCYIYCWGFEQDEDSSVSTVGDLEGQITNYYD